MTSCPRRFIQITNTYSSRFLLSPILLYIFIMRTTFGTFHMIRLNIQDIKCSKLGHQLGKKTSLLLLLFKICLKCHYFRAPLPPMTLRCQPVAFWQMVPSIYRGRGVVSLAKKKNKEENPLLQKLPFSKVKKPQKYYFILEKKNHF